MTIPSRNRGDPAAGAVHGGCTAVTAAGETAGVRRQRRGMRPVQLRRRTQRRRGEIPANDGDQERRARDRFLRGE